MEFIARYRPKGRKLQLGFRLAALGLCGESSLIRLARQLFRKKTRMLVFLRKSCRAKGILGVNLSLCGESQIRLAARLFRNLPSLRGKLRKSLAANQDFRDFGQLDFT